MRSQRYALFSVFLFASALEARLSSWLNDLGNEPGLLRGLTDFLAENSEFRRAELPDTTPERDAVYDFVVVGAGSAGSAVTGRLSEIDEARTLLIEAGSLEDLFMDVPLTLGGNLLRPDVNWMYKTERSDRYCVYALDGRCSWPAGRVMGGSSVINGLIATRGQPQGYDEWAEMGNVGWAYKDLLPYFKKLETVESPQLASDTVNHGTNGPVYISQPTFRTPLAKSFLEAGSELGYPLPNDTVGGNLMGFAFPRTTMKNGTRFSGNRAYLVPIAGRDNVHLTRNSYARRVIFDDEGKRAIGVEFAKRGRVIAVYARKEVILCAGVMRSPQLLMLSGIGPKDDLAGLGIEVLRDAPVGRNLMDHVGVPLNFFTPLPATWRLGEILGPFSPYVKEYLLRRTGPLTMPGGFEVHGYVNVNDPKDTNGIPNMELIFFSTNVCAAYWPCAETINKNAWTVLAYVNRPRSRGYLRLKSKNVRDKPVIVPNYLEDPEDVRLLVKGIRIAVNLSRTEAMSRYKSELFRPHLPNCDVLEYQSDEYWECFSRAMTAAGSHYAGTCKMGPEEDPTAVVNPRLQVIGVKGLRVADGSIIPIAPAAHPNIPTYMIGEKLADMIKEDWGYL